ncbi:MAG: radical SAM protein [Methanomassiliicoccaceae archaeon]|nr:radical SAM protein [Methanomassiliicoccaceae archaeon]
MTKIITIAIKPTLSCNIDCKHCYHPLSERSDTAISKETLEKVIRSASEEYETAWFIWHGGEPLLLPLSFYKNAISLQEKYFGKDSHRVSNTIQTNGTILNKKFAEFCREKKVNVGISFEGHCNNVLRERTDDVNENIKMMKKNGHKFTVCATICKESTDDMIKMYDRFIGNGMALSFSPVIELGGASSDMIPDADGYAKASIDAFERWLYDTDAEMPLMPFMNYVLSALGNETPADCSRSSCLTKWICVYPNGDLYPCAKGCPPELRLCNISEIERLSNAFGTDAMFRMLSSSIERREKCATECKLFSYCNGGCSVDALSEGSMSNNGGTSCTIFRKVFTHILGTMNRILADRPDLSVYNKFVRDAVIGRLVDPAEP